MSAGYETGRPIMEQTPAMGPHLEHLGKVASNALAVAPDREQIFDDTVVSQVVVDSGDTQDVAHFVGNSDGARVTVGSYIKGGGNGQRETTVAISGDIPEINTVKLSAAEAGKIGRSLSSKN